jgi:hypothetical protein
LNCFWNTGKLGIAFVYKNFRDLFIQHYNFFPYLEAFGWIVVFDHAPGFLLPQLEPLELNEHLYPSLVCLD